MMMPNDERYEYEKIIIQRLRESPLYEKLHSQVSEVEKRVPYAHDTFRVTEDIVMSLEPLRKNVLRAVRCLTTGRLLVQDGGQIQHMIELELVEREPTTYGVGQGYRITDKGLEFIEKLEGEKIFQDISLS